MRCILHVGTHKTGTTTVQRFAAANRAALADLGILYPGYASIGKRSQYAHHHLAHALSSRPTDLFPAECVAPYLAAVKAEAEKRNATILISAEPIYRHLSGPPEASYWDRREHYVRAVAEAFAGLDPEIVIVFRRQDEFAESLYQEAVKSRQCALDLQEFINQAGGFLDYFANYELFSRYFRVVRAINYHDISGPDLVNQFFSILGFNVSALPPVPNSNEGLPSDLVYYLRELNRYGRAPALGHASAALQAVARRRKQSSKARLLTPAERHSLMQQYLESNRRLAESAFGLKDETSLFGEPKLHPFAPPLTEADRSRITLELVEAMVAGPGHKMRRPKTAVTDHRGVMECVGRLWARLAKLLSGR